MFEIVTLVPTLSS